MGSLDKKVAVDTGGGRGIGRGISEVLAREGARLVIATGSSFASTRRSAGRTSNPPASKIASKSLLFGRSRRHAV